MGNHFGETFSVLHKVQEFPTSVGCFHEITTDCLNTLTQLANLYLHVLYMYMYMYMYIKMCYYCDDIIMIKKETQSHTHSLDMQA